MKWKKHGKIFSPSEFTLPNNCKSFAQSPQALVFENFVRIYFSTRSQDPNGKFVSHIAFVDMNKSLTAILGVSKEPVIELGGLGCFDEHGIFPMNVLKHKDLVYGYTCGWSRRVSVSVETSIGLAISKDNGVTFSRQGDGPILSSSLNEPFLVGDAFVKNFGGLFHMWYIFGVGWRSFSEKHPPDRIYKIGHTTSRDGISWTKSEEGRQVVSDLLGAEESQALPTVVEHNGKYHMFFCYRHSSDFRKNKLRGYRIGYAYSEDLDSWKRDDVEGGVYLSESGWDSEMMCYPNVFKCDDKIYLLYNGNEFGREGFGVASLI